MGIKPMGPDRLRRRHISALALVAALTLAGQVVIQYALWRQQADAGFLNIAGRQRMLSQRITQLALRAVGADLGDAAAARAQLPALLETWRTAHLDLLRGDAGLGPTVAPDSQVVTRLAGLAPALAALASAVEALLAVPRDPHGAAAPAAARADAPADARALALAQLLAAQDAFVSGMDETVFLAAQESDQRVRTLRRIELAQLALVLLTLVFEWRWILRPAVGGIAESLRLAEASAQARGAAEAAQAAVVAALPDRLVRLSVDGHRVANLGGGAPAGPPLDDLWQPDGVPVAALARLVATARTQATVAGPEDVLLAAGAGPAGARAAADRVAGSGAPGSSALSSVPAAPPGARGEPRAAEEAPIVELRVVPLEAPPGMLMLARDVSQARRAERALFAADEAARRAVGRDLHDGLCQELAALHYLARFMAGRAPAEGGGDQAGLARLAAQLEHAVEAGRRLSRGLYPLELEAGGLGLALRTLAERATVPGGVEVTVAFAAPPAWRAEIDLQLYRIAQEALANALRHATPRRVTVSVAPTATGWSLSVCDDGVGPGPGARLDPGAGGLPRGLGLESMARRAALIGARLEVHPNPGGGTCVRCEVPVVEASGREGGGHPGREALDRTGAVVGAAARAAVGGVAGADGKREGTT